MSASGGERPSMLMVAGQTVDVRRADDSRRGLVPRNDITELQRRFGADIVDFAWLADHAGNGPGRLLPALARKTGRWSELLSLRSFFATRRYDAVYATGEDVGLLLAAVTRLGFWRRQRIAVRIENPRYGRSPLRRAVYERALRFALERMDVVICRTEAHARLLRSWTRREPRRIVAFPQEVDTSFFDPDSDVVPDATSSVPAGTYLVSAGLEMRDYETLLSAVADLPVSVVIGASSPWSKDRFAVETIPPNVTAGRFTAREMRELYRGARVVVLATLPTDRACGMNVVAEAWAMGRPVVAATEGLRETVRAGEGRAVAPFDADGLRREIVALLDSDEAAASAGRVGRRYAEEHLSLDQFVETVTVSIRGGGGRHNRR